jgi:DNA-binding NarL/FixJ family response regulator
MVTVKPKIKTIVKDKYGSRKLKNKELLIIRYIAEGLRNKDIANYLNITDYVIRNYVRRMYDKIGMSNRVEAALWYLGHEEQVLKEIKDTYGISLIRLTTGE